MVINIKYPSRALFIGAFLFINGCQTGVYSPNDSRSVKPIKSLSELEDLSEVSRKITIAVYDFPDLTGAFKSNDAFAVYSKAVPQGADTIVIDALLKAGNGSWFNVLERKGLNSLVQERKIVEVNQNIRKKSQENAHNLLGSIQKSLSQKNVDFRVNNNLGNIPNNSNNPLKINQEANFGLNQQGSLQQSQPAIQINTGNKLLQSADYLIQGGIVGYDSDEITSGGGLRLLNIGGFGEIRKDIVTVNIRLVDVSTGNIVLNKTLCKGIYSQKIQGASFGYVDVDKILETEIGFSHNEPVFEALNLTIQTAVLDMIKQGLKRNLWQYKQVNNFDPMNNQQIIHQNSKPIRQQNIQPTINQSMKPIAEQDIKHSLHKDTLYELASTNSYY